MYRLDKIYLRNIAYDEIIRTLNLSPDTNEKQSLKNQYIFRFTKNLKKKNIDRVRQIIRPKTVSDLFSFRNRFYAHI